MGSKKISAPSVGLLCLLLQVTGGLAEWVQCRPGFTEDRYTFSVPGTLEAGTVLGKVSFDRCTEQKTTHYVSEDQGFEVQADGIVLAKHQIKLHGSKRSFIVHTRADADWTFFTVVALQSKKHHHKKQESSPEEHAGLLPKSMSGRKRQKRDWVIPPISVSENQKDPFPKNLVQIKSSKDKEIRLFYSITGQGADTPPVGVFIIERETGWMKVAKKLDREEIALYSLSCHAVSANGQSAEDPMPITIKVIDQNDNEPQFTEKVFHGSVAEGSRPGTSVMTVTATDADDSVDFNHGVIGYSIISQDPQVPSDQMFTINNQTGMISVIATGLDRETTPQYTVYIRARDDMGKGWATTGTAVITLTDMNDNPPIFDSKTYTVNVPENEEDVEVERLTVTDADVANTDAWHAVYNIVKGNEANLFGVTTVNNNIGLLKTIKPLDFEVKKEYILHVAVTNKDNFSMPLPTSTATITVTVLDVNEAPVFQPPTKTVDISEDLPNGQEVASYTAQDPDKAQNQTILYSIGFDPAGWLSVDKDNGIITGKGNLDRESQFVQNSTYKAIILAVDNGSPLATGTGTLLIHLLDVNDNSPFLDPQDVSFCQKDTIPQSLNIVDRDLPPNTGPFTAELLRESHENWTAQVIGDKFEIKPLREMEIGTYNVPIRMKDNMGLVNVMELKATVCRCEGDSKDCEHKAAYAGVMGVPAILGILGGILALLVLLLLLLLLVRRKRVVKEDLLLPVDETRDNLHCYDEEGGGEEDQDFDLSQLHRGLDARPDVIRNDVIPTLVPAPQYRPRPANPDEIGNFIDENLNAADNDPTAPPYDSLLVFNYEGSGSEAASLSSLNSSSSDRDQDYSALNDWGPRFTKLADMCGGGDEE